MTCRLRSPWKHFGNTENYINNYNNSNSHATLSDNSFLNQSWWYLAPTSLIVTPPLCRGDTVPAPLKQRRSSVRQVRCDSPASHPLTSPPLQLAPHLLVDGPQWKGGPYSPSDTLSPSDSAKINSDCSYWRGINPPTPKPFQPGEKWLSAGEIGYWHAAE